MTHYKNGDVILIEFPFSDLSGVKKRPVAVLTSIQHRKELIVVMLTSTKKVDAAVDYPVQNTRKAGLKEVTHARTSRLFTIKESKTLRKIGELEDKELEVIVTKVILILRGNRN